MNESVVILLDLDLPKTQFFLKTHFASLLINTISASPTGEFVYRSMFIWQKKEERRERKEKFKKRKERKKEEIELKESKKKLVRRTGRDIKKNFFKETKFEKEKKVIESERNKTKISPLIVYFRNFQQEDIYVFAIFPSI